MEKSHLYFEESMHLYVLPIVYRKLAWILKKDNFYIFNTFLPYNSSDSHLYTFVRGKHQIIST